ncbi:MAG: hypothetical protein IPH12_06675 [Saprospirales bacterium]|nr:hypothetical protein [Saprospirales bacterium]
MEALSHTPARIAAGAGLGALTLLLGYIVQRSDFGALAGTYALFFGLYSWVVTRPYWTAADRRWFTGLGIGLRCTLLFSLPNLSDDFYRFLWDGNLAAHGIHPFAHPPAYFIENHLHLPGITPELYGRLNSTEYYTVYPPVCQAAFWLAAKAFPENIQGGVFVLKLFLLACELGTLQTLGRVAENGLAAQNLYALNPLLLIEITGNVHFEGAMLCFVLAGIAALQRHKIRLAAVFWALATASKLVPLLFLPVIWVHLGWRRGGRFLLFFTGACALLFAPLLHSGIVANMAGSLDLYFRQFEFNASVYYLLKWAGEAVAPAGTDVARTLGPALALLVFFGVMGIACYKRTLTGLLPGRFLAASTLYLLLSTTVHPWYVALPFALGLRTAFRFPWIWTAAAILSYSHYAGGGFRENYAWIAAEYGLVAAALVWDIWRAGKQHHSFELSPTK